MHSDTFVLYKSINLLFQQYNKSMPLIRNYKKTVKILFLVSNLNRDTDVIIFSRALYFLFQVFNHVILLII